MKYKVGNKVRVKSINWYDTYNNGLGAVCFSDTPYFISSMKQYCGKVMTIAEIENGVYRMKEDNSVFDWVDEMIEGLVEEKTKFGTASNPIEPKSNANCLTQEKVDEMSLDKAGEITDFEYEGLAYTLPDGYIFKDENGNVINTTKIVLEKKKKEYPKTYKECCEVLNWNHRDYDRVGYKSVLLCKLQVLLLCRDAYWKIAGEEMRLGKSWEPDWKHGKDKFYCISASEGEIVLGEWYIDNKILAFPTKEMRDAFYENFKDLIELVKELL